MRAAPGNHQKIHDRMRPTVARYYDILKEDITIRIRVGLGEDNVIS